MVLSSGAGDIPLACLVARTTVVFPHSVATLEITRPENLAALAHHAGGDAPIAAVPLSDLAEPTREQGIHRTAALCRVLDRMPLAAGGERIVLQGLRRVALARLRAENGCFRAEAVELDDSLATVPPAELSLAFEAVRELVHCDERYAKDLPRALAANLDDPSGFVDRVAARLHLAYEDAARLLVERDLRARLAHLRDVLRRELARAVVAHALKDKVDERLRQGYLREQLQVIRAELGVLDPLETEVQSFRERIASSSATPAAVRAMTRELDHLARSTPASPEASRIRNWLDWTLEFPWDVSSSDRDVHFSRVMHVLDRTHEGLADVKNRVTEFLAVERLGGASRGTVLCFHGPPGTGKTSLARAVADALGRPFVHVSLGGMTEEGELRGRHHTQPGAVAGRILQGIFRAGTNNPVILVDEIDKVHIGGEEGTGSALLEVLDPEQNREFLDHYLGVPFDLSRCIFLATANDTRELPPALLDRLEMIPFGSYTETEKLAIARAHLLPRARTGAGVKARQLRLAQGALREIVRHYTEEAGVRQLARALEALARKAAVEVVRRRGGLHVRKQDLLELLGPANADEELHVESPRVGVATALAWTAAGGAILSVEAVAVPGAGRTTLTGSVGEVMRESVQTALSYVRTRFKDLCVAPDALDTLDLHLHFPSGATPKDGPSAGVAIACSLVSLLTGAEVRHDVAMTGEMSLHGAVLPVGGLREKLLAALRCGVRTVIAPARNREELERLPPEVRGQVRVHLIQDVEEAFDLALLPRRASKRESPAAGPRRRSGPRKRPGARRRSVPGARRKAS